METEDLIKEIIERRVGIEGTDYMASLLRSLADRVDAWGCEADEHAELFPATENA